MFSNENINKYVTICKDFDCKMDIMGYIYSYDEDFDKFIRVGKIYTTDKSSYFHSKSMNNVRFEGQLSFEEALETLLKGVDFL